jgi:hypothetical protein
MRSDKDYFVCNRSLFKNPLWYSEKFTKGQAWIDLFGKANHSDGWFEKNGQRVDIKRGQTGRSIEKLGEEWGWSRNKVKRFLKRLEDDHMIERKPNHLTTIITICNYDKYQISSKHHEPSNEPPDEPPDEPQTIKNKERIKEEVNKTSKVFDDDSTEMKIAKYFFSVLLKSNPKQQEPNWQNWCKDIDLFLRKVKPTKEEIKKVIDWAHDPGNSTEKFSWIPNLRSPKKLREHFEKILLQMKHSGKKNNGKSIAEKMNQESEQTSKSTNELL